MIHGAQGRRWINAEVSATRSSRRHRTISLPVSEDAYAHVVHDPARFRRLLDVGPDVGGLQGREHETVSLAPGKVLANRPGSAGFDEFAVPDDRFI
jgi:hypothetical protein